jgi:quercetin dioxygenase-like cupin family protein
MRRSSWAARTGTLVCLAAFLASGIAKAEPIVKMTLSELALIANPKIEGVSAAFVVGAFDADGLYAARSTMAKGAVFPPHRHTDLRLTQVLSGTMYLAEGNVIDDAMLVAYPAGSVALTPPGTWHYMVAKDGDFTVLEIGSGPSETEFAEN